jgi:hypothetical protein
VQAGSEHYFEVVRGSAGQLRSPGSGLTGLAHAYDEDLGTAYTSTRTMMWHAHAHQCSIHTTHE